MAIIVPEPRGDKLYRAELLAIMQADIDKHPRSAQSLLGPSGVGGCERKVAWSLAYGAASEGPGGWAAHKGTQLHRWLEETFSESDRTMPDGSPRFFPEIALESSAPDILAGGTCDLYDALHQRTVDWKAPGSWSTKQVRNGEMSSTYFVQAQIYGYHLSLMGRPVQTVSIMYLPMDGDDLHSEAKGAMLFVWDYDESVAKAAVDNLKRIKTMLELAPVQSVLDVMEKKSDFCSNCPASIMSGDRRSNCPGVTPTFTKPQGNPFGV